MSIRRMSLGAGYRYLMSSVARADGSGHAASALTRYYAESGTPPGRFLGRGLAGLNNGNGVPAGSAVTEEYLFRMLGMLQDPITGEPLGRSPRRSGPAHVDSRGVARKAPLPVAGFDLTFSAPQVRECGVGGRGRGDAGADLCRSSARAGTRHRLRGGARVLLPVGQRWGGAGGHRWGGRGGVRSLGLARGGPAAAHACGGDEQGSDQRRGMADAGFPGPVPVRGGPVGDVQRGAVGLPCLLYTSPSPRDGLLSRMPSSA